VPKYKQHKKTNRYSNEFKTKAVQLSLMDGVQVQAVAKTLDIHPFMLSRWRKEYREGVIVPDNRKKVVSLKKDKTEIDKIKRLEKENARLKQENDLLKKWQRFLAEERGSDLDSSSDTDKTSE
jgi:transposase